MFKRIICFISGLLLIALFVGTTSSIYNNYHVSTFCKSSSIPDDNELDEPEIYDINFDLES